MTVECIGVSSASLAITVETKNQEEVDGSATAVTAASGSLAAITGTGVTSARYTAGFEEWVRFKYVVTGAATTWIHFRMLAPVWESN